MYWFNHRNSGIKIIWNFSVKLRFVLYIISESVRWRPAMCACAYRLATPLLSSGMQMVLMLSQQPLLPGSEKEMGAAYKLLLHVHVSTLNSYRFKVWHFSGCLVTQHDLPPKQELLEVTWMAASDAANYSFSQVKWRPSVDSFPPPDLTARPSEVAEQPKSQGENPWTLII